MCARKMGLGVRGCSQKSAAQACRSDVYSFSEAKLFRSDRFCASVSLARAFAHIGMHRVVLLLVAFAQYPYIELTRER